MGFEVRKNYEHSHSRICRPALDPGDAHFRGGGWPSHHCCVLVHDHDLVVVLEGILGFSESLCVVRRHMGPRPSGHGCLHLLDCSLRDGGSLATRRWVAARFARFVSGFIPRPPRIHLKRYPNRDIRRNHPCWIFRSDSRRQECGSPPLSSLKSTSRLSTEDRFSTLEVAVELSRISGRLLGARWLGISRDSDVCGHTSGGFSQPSLPEPSD